MKSTKENKICKIENFLKSLGDPKIWYNYNGRYSEVTTPLT